MTSATPRMFLRAVRRSSASLLYPERLRLVNRTRWAGPFFCRPTDTNAPLFVLSRSGSHVTSRPRRRRKGDAGARVPQPSESDREDEGRAVHHAPVKDLEVFRQEADRCLSKIAAALKPMEPHNDVFAIEHTPRNAYMAGSLTLTLSPDEGMYSLEVDDEAMVMYFQSPISGKMLYILSSRTHEWVSQQDGHSFEGLLVRDLIRQCNGLPNL